MGAEELKKIVVVQGEESNEKRCISNDGKKSCADSNYVQEVPKEKCGQIDGTSNCIFGGNSKAEALEKQHKSDVHEHTTISVVKRRNRRRRAHFTGEEPNTATANSIQEKYSDGNPSASTGNAMVRRGRGFKGEVGINASLSGGMFHPLRSCRERTSSKQQILGARETVGGRDELAQDEDMSRTKDDDSSYTKRETKIVEGNDRSNKECIQEATVEGSQTHLQRDEVELTQFATRGSDDARRKRSVLREGEVADVAHEGCSIVKICRSSRSEHIAWPKVAFPISDEYDERNRLILKWLNTSKESSKVESLEWSNAWEQQWGILFGHMHLQNPKFFPCTLRKCYRLELKRLERGRPTIEFSSGSAT